MHLQVHKHHFLAGLYLHYEPLALFILIPFQINYQDLFQFLRCIYYNASQFNLLSCKCFLQILRNCVVFIFFKFCHFFLLKSCVSILLLLFFYQKFKLFCFFVKQFLKVMKQYLWIFLISVSKFSCFFSISSSLNRRKKN